MAYKNININVAASQSIVGAATRARVRVRDGRVQVRFTDRTNVTNLPKDELLVNLGVKGQGRRLGLKSAVADYLETGSKVNLVADKYSWYTVLQVVDAQIGDLLVAGSVTAK